MVALARRRWGEEEKPAVLAHLWNITDTIPRDVTWCRAFVLGFRFRAKKGGTSPQRVIGVTLHSHVRYKEI